MNNKTTTLTMVAFLLHATATYSQSSSASNTSTIPPQFLGFSGVGIGGPKILEVRNNYPLPINIFTFSKFTAQFSVLNSLPSFATPSTSGDGLSIRSPFGSLYNLDMWTDGALTVNQHIRWGQFGLIEGGSNRLQITGHIEGLELIASNPGPGSFPGTPRIIFRRGSLEIARFGANNFLRIGENPTNIINLDATRRFEIVDPSLLAQFRITNIQNAAGVSTVFTDFQTTNLGDLVLFPTNNTFAVTRRRVGINIFSPQNTLEIQSTVTGVLNPISSFGPTRSGLRFTQLNSLLLVDAANNTAPSHPTATVLSVNETGDVILVNGGTVSAANNGTSISTITPSAVVLGQNILQAGNPGRLISDREIPMNNFNIVFTNPGLPIAGKNRIGIGTTTPQAEVEIFSNLAGTNTLPIVRNGGTVGAGWRLIAGGAGAKDWAIHSTGTGNTQGAGKIAFHCINDSTDAMTLTSTGIFGEGRVGIGTFSPGNLLEINTTDPLPTTTIGGKSGLRFRDLTSVSSTTPNPGNGVLSVDPNGNVIYVPGGIGGGLIGICPTLPTLAADAGTSLNGNDFHFLDGPAGGSNSVGIGHPSCSSPPSGKLDIRNMTQATGIEISTNFSSTGTVYGIRSHTTGSSTNNYAVWGEATGSAPNTNTGVRGLAVDASKLNIGGFFVGGIQPSSSGSTNIGVWASAGSGPLNYGIYASATFSQNNYAGYFDGYIWGSGISTTPGNNIQSDRQLKKDTAFFTDGISIIRNINPVSYRYNGKARIDTTHSHIGVIAENLATIAPWAVDTFYAKLDSLDPEPTLLLSVKNEAIIYTSLNAIKQLDSAVTKINSAPLAPTLLFPADAAVIDSNAIHFTWNTSIGGVSSEVQVSHASDFSSLYASSTIVVGATNLFSIQTLDTLIFYWRVRMHNGAGTSAWSEIRTVTLIHTPPPAPVLISPANGTVGNFCGQQQFTWHAIPNGPALYDIQIAKDAVFTILVNASGEIHDTTILLSLGSTANVFRKDNPSANVFIGGGADTGMYYWRVRASYNGAVGQFSTPFSFYNNTPCGGGGGVIAFSVATGFGSESDSRLKTNITPITGALDKISQLNGLSYDWLHDNTNYQFDSTRQIGFIAQDIQSIIPEVVRPDSNGYLTLDYGRMVPVLVEAIKTLKAQVDSLKYSSAHNDSPENDTRQYAELVSPTSILYVNIPNPFSDETTIRYYVPENTGSAVMIFYDEMGNQVKEVELAKKGNNSIILNTTKLASGIYSYSLVVDGKIVDTKKMIKTK